MAERRASADLADAIGAPAAGLRVTGGGEPAVFFWGWLCGWCAVAFVALIPIRVLVGPPAWNLEWSDVAGGLFVVSAVCAGLWRRVPLDGITVSALVYLGVMIPSIIWSVHPAGSLAEFVKTAYLVCLGLLMARWLLEAAAWDRLIQAFSLALALIISLTIGLWLVGNLSGRVLEPLAIRLTVPNVGSVVRVKATLQTIAMLANYVTMGLPLLIGWAASRSRRPHATSWLVIAGGLTAAAATASHGVVGCLLAAAMMAPRRGWWERMARAALYGLAVAAFLFGLVSSTVSFHGLSWSRSKLPQGVVEMPLHAVPDGGARMTAQIDYVWVHQGRLKQLAWQTWLRHPWVGIGLGQFRTVSEQATAAGWMNGAWDAHSEWFGALAETGLLGLAGLLGLWAAVWRQAAGLVCAGAGEWRLRASLAGLAGLLVNGLHVDVMHFRFLWVGVALVASCIWAARRQPAPEARADA